MKGLRKSIQYVRKGMLSLLRYASLFIIIIIIQPSTIKIAVKSDVKTGHIYKS